MNAAIEAAHAGDTGRGFGVVADEIRKLADSSGEQSSMVSLSLESMKRSIDTIQKSADAVFAQFEDIDARIRLVALREQEIQAAMVEQDAGGQQVLLALAELRDITGAVKSGSAEMVIGNCQVLEESARLADVTRKLAGSVSEIASGSEQTGMAVEAVAGLSQQTETIMI